MLVIICCTASITTHWLTMFMIPCASVLVDELNQATVVVQMHHGFEEVYPPFPWGQMHNHHNRLFSDLHAVQTLTIRVAPKFLLTVAVQRQSCHGCSCMFQQIAWHIYPHDSRLLPFLLQLLLKLRSMLGNVESLDRGMVGACDGNPCVSSLWIFQLHDCSQGKSKLVGKTSENSCNETLWATNCNHCMVLCPHLRLLIKFIPRFYHSSKLSKLKENSLAKCRTEDLNMDAGICFTQQGHLTRSAKIRVCVCVCFTGTWINPSSTRQVERCSRFV